jgi:hypothetical protein
MLRALRIEYLDAIYQWPTVCNRPKTKVNRTTNMNSALCKYSGLTPLKNNPNASVVNLNDHPNIPCFGTTTRFDNYFKCYVVFRPDEGDPSENIYVTLGTLNWQGRATTVKSNGVWQSLSYYIPTPSAPDDSDAFRHWERIFYNSL